MFRTGSPYSPFFTSGLLAFEPSLRRGSLPTDASPRQQTNLMQQPEYRSFLSLDLAESQSMRSASLKPKLLAPISQINPLRLRFSRDSLRSLPSRKPVPSITLPELPPAISSTPPRLPSLTPLPALDLTLPPKSTLHVSRTPAPAKVARLRMSVATKSSASSSVKRANRSDALARLEGRMAARSPTPPLPTWRPEQQQHHNFMSMSDDEEDDNDSGADPADLDGDFDYLDFATVLNPVLEPEDIVLPLLSLPHLEAPRSAPLPSKPKHKSKQRSNKPSSSKPKRSQRSSNDWFPLKSFIDFRGDEEASISSWSWRSFVEVAHVS